MDKYYVFHGSHYYPLGGIDDLKFSGTLAECYKYLAGRSCDWYQIVNSSLQLVESK